MSESESFINEITEEVRRDRLYRLLRRYGWIGVVAVFAIVGGAAWNEYSKASARATAQERGDAVLKALESDSVEERVSALSDIDAGDDGAAVIIAMLVAAEQEAEEDRAQAAETLEAASRSDTVPQVYRDIALFKSLLNRAGTLSAEDRRAGFETLARPGNPLRLVAQEQIAIIALENGEADIALAAFAEIVEDAEATADLRWRASQAIVALGGEPEES